MIDEAKSDQPLISIAAWITAAMRSVSMVVVPVSPGLRKTHENKRN